MVSYDEGKLNMIEDSAKVTWAQFASTVTEKDGITRKFENLCRQLFINEFFSGRIYPHSNPNNPGIEIEPLFDDKTKQWISFQAKYFESNINYQQIYDSAQKTVTYYKDKLDILYLFCNKSINKNAQKYKQIEAILKSNNIQLEIINNEAILDRVRKYETLCFFYFGAHNITQSWLYEKNQLMFRQLGKRFNQEFNVDTENSSKLSLFVIDNTAIDYINNKKKTLFNEVLSIKQSISKTHIPYLLLIEESTKKLQDIEMETIKDSYKWKDTIEKICHKEIKELERELNQLEDNQSKLQPKLGIINADAKDKEDYRSILQNIQEIRELLNLPKVLEVTPEEQNLLNSNFLIVEGSAGMGKSQLFANEAMYLQTEEKRNSLLILAESYHTKERALKQTMDILGCSFSFSNLINTLETIGQNQKRIMPIFIDGLNESSYIRIWRDSIIEIEEKINKCKYVKLAISFRSEFETMIVPDDLINKINNKSIVKIEVAGFEDNPLEAIRIFFNKNNIPFGLSDYFNYNLTNPLFLMLYCETYTKDDNSDLSTLYKKYISKMNSNIYQSTLEEKGYSIQNDLLTPLIQDIANHYIQTKRKYITQDDLLSLPYWNKYRILPIPYLNAIQSEGLLRRYQLIDESTIYSFAFDQMNDYFEAERIVKNAKSKEELRDAVTQLFFSPESEEQLKYYDAGLFAHVCAFYREQYGEECIDLLETLHVYPLFFGFCVNYYKEYLNSFLWRKESCIDFNSFFKCITNNSNYILENQTVWNVFIGNSTKVNHPLNANALHNLLKSYELNIRDFLWTCSINRIWDDDSDRLYQLIKLCNEDEFIEIKDKAQIELLLTLFCWLLTSSNRFLRDNTSKAMIELLKSNFNLCEVLLKKFENANDPYVAQRLYAVVFGACCKRQQNTMGIYTSLAEYVYKTIFDKDIIYPDILLRDYARLIIELFLYERPNYDGIINKDRIKPPYKSNPIPKVEEDFNNLKFEEGVAKIQSSMRFDNTSRLYGDFGRYVFQSNLKDFAINDESQIFNYAMHFIINELGYKNEFFSKFDRQCHDMGETKKQERIGKKYQWIALYNILARVSDNYKWKEDPYSSKTEFEGAEDLFLRDFDPTLNWNAIKDNTLPYFEQIPQFITDSQSDIKEDYQSWLKEKGIFFNGLKDIMILDKNNIKWVLLSVYLDTGRRNLKKEKHLVQSNLFAYFITEEQEKAFINNVKKKEDLRTSELTPFNQTYEIFNREYPWSHSCKELLNNSYFDVSLYTGKKIEVEKLQDDPITIDTYLSLLRKLGFKGKRLKETLISSMEPFDGNGKIREEISKLTLAKLKGKVFYETKKVKVKEEIGKIQHADNIITWEGKYDTSVNDVFEKYVPCAEIIEMFNLKQQNNDNAYYDEQGKLASFDLRFSQEIEGMVLRKDLLDSYLEKTKKKLIWILSGEKSINNTDGILHDWKSWTGMYLYKKDKIQEYVYMIEDKRY